ncbi:hypothetical protein ABIE67_004816 [Streptomyces sp. V4I8]|uniref:hypothetical protein n=1 Tax=Streptomyces sp. V4I8 TaxID=3156469 RepID=UPI003519AA55
MESARPERPGEPGKPGKSSRAEELRQSRQAKHSKASPTSSAHGPAAARPTPSDEPSRAGSRAGEGRERPGREKGPLEDEEAVPAERRDRGEGEREGEDDGGSAPPERSEDTDDAADAAGEASTAPSAPADPPAREPVAHAEDPTEPVLQVLPLGTGLVLIGLGLGLAFVGLRLRRG